MTRKRASTRVVVRIFARLRSTVDSFGQLTAGPFLGIGLALIVSGRGGTPPWIEGVIREYYVVIASVIPVLLLAGMVEAASALRVGTVVDLDRRLSVVSVELEGLLREFDSQHPDALAARELVDKRGQVRAQAGALLRGHLWIVRGMFVTALVGEGACLYAIAASTSTAFTFMLAASNALVLFVLLAAAFEARFRLDRG